MTFTADQGDDCMRTKVMTFTEDQSARYTSQRTNVMTQSLKTKMSEHIH